MCESYSRSLLRVSVAQICQALGWDSVQVTACDLLTDVLHRYLQQLCRGAHRYSELYGRTDAVLDDVGQAFKLMGVNLNELEDYIHNIEPVTFPHQLPSFPVSKNNVLQFPPPDSKDVEDRKEYIPDYLPLIASSQEEEEEEQVPTDGGTSAEAMQVPLEEEEEEMEDDETVNDENYLSKRPLSSPENMEMPFAKRPRLANIKGDVLDGNLEPREPLSSINTQKVPPISPTPIQDNVDLADSSEPLTLPPVSKSQPAPSKPLESKALNSKSKSKGGSPGQKTKSPKSTPVAAVLGSPMRSPKSGPKEKKSPGRAKSPKSPKSPKGPAAVPVKAETPVRTPLAALSEKIGKENIQIKQTLAPLDTEKLNPETPSKKPSVTDNTIEDSIDAVIARACAEQELDPFEFSSGSESEDEVFTSPKRLTISEPTTPKVSSSSNSLAKPGSNPAPPSGGTSSSDISWTMDDSINEVIRKVNQETPSNIPGNPQCFSSPSASPPTPEPLLKLFEDKAKLASPVEVKKKAKKEVKAKMKKKDKEKIKEKDKDKERTKDKNKEKNKEKEKDKDGGKESKSLWKDAIRDDETEMQRFKLKDFNDPEVKSKQKENSGKKDKEKHKDKKKDKGKKEKKDKGKDKNKEDKLKTSAPILLTPKEIALPTISTPSSVRLPSLLSTMSPLLPEKLFEDKEKPKEKDKKKEKKEKKKKKDKEKAKEKDKKEKDKKEKDKDKHKHEKQVKTELSIPASAPVIPRLTLRVGAGQDTIVISKVVPTPDGKQSAPLALPKSPPPAPSPAPAPVVIPPPPVKAPPVPAAPSPAPKPAPPPAAAGNTSNSRTPVRSVVTETVSVYVIRDEMGNQIWICPGCNKPDDGSPMIGCDGCDDWYHWPCVGIKDDPTEDEWFCKKCDTKKRDKKHKKRKHKAH